MSQQQDTKSVSSTGSGTLSVAKEIEREARDYLAKKGVGIGEPVMPTRKSGRTGPGPGDVELSTNVYPTVVKDRIIVYRYDVTIVGIKAREPHREMQFTRKFKDDYTLTDRRLRSRDVIITFMNAHNQIATQAGTMYHDLQSIMYSLHPLEQANKNQPLEFKFNSDKLHNAELFAQHKLDHVKLIFKPTANFQVALENVPQQSNLVYVNRDLAQFLDIATSQEIFFREGEHVHFSTSNSYMINPETFGFSQADTVSFDENLTYLAIGCQKAIHTVQGPASQQQLGMPAVVVAPKKTPFHADALLQEKVNAMTRSAPRGVLQSQAALVQYLDKNLKGLMVMTTHNSRNVQYFPIKGFTIETAVQKQVTIGNQEISVADYFLQKYKVTLQNPNWPLVVTETRIGTGADGGKQKNKNYYPIEVLRVCDNQRVTTQQLTPKMTQESIKKCAIPPFFLRDQVVKVARALHIFENEELSNANVHVQEQPLKVFAQQLSSPQIKSADAQMTLDFNRGTWNANRVLQPQQLVGKGYEWAAFAFQSPDQPRIQQSDFEQFVFRYQQQASPRGIQLGQPKKKQVIQLNNLAADMLPHFQWANENNLAFMLCFHADSDDQAHHQIKAFEHSYFVITQCVKFGTVRNVIMKNQRLTIDNILNKSNVKLGGLNFTLPSSKIATDVDTLVIGFFSNHPAGGFGAGPESESGSNPNKPPSFITGPPTVVGFAANVGPTKTPFDFVGDFVFQRQRREEKVNVIELIVQRCLHFFKATRDGKLPTRVILYRNGCSEGQFPMLLKYEVPLLKAALMEANCNAQITMIVPNKLQNVRFFQRQLSQGMRAPEQNLKPGTVIDNGAVHPTFVEFFLNSHRALQGTARTPKYTLVYDDADFQLEDLERITYDLCFGHQIVFSPLSLPAPVYIAMEYAKRGRNLYNANIDELRRKEPNLQYNDLNESITFFGKDGNNWIAEYRVNA